VCDSCIEIRQGNAVDVIEIDAATNRGIDEIRELRDAARYAPSRDRYKIYILDEAHQITDAAFNALLKTLEEPPAHVIFMMATTQPEDIPQTIRSRCQHFSFHAVKFDDILAQLKMIAGQEQVEAEDAALALLAEAGDGSMRDALSIMDQAIASAPVEDGRPCSRRADSRADGLGAQRRLRAAAGSRRRRQSAELMEQLNLLVNAGHSPRRWPGRWSATCAIRLMAKLGGEQTELLQISGDERARAARTALLFTEEELTRNLQIVLRTFDDLNYRQEQRFHLELGLLKLIHAQRLLPIEELLSGVAARAVFAWRSGSAQASARASASAQARSAVSASSGASGCISLRSLRLLLRSFALWSVGQAVGIPAVPNPPEQRSGAPRFRAPGERGSSLTSASAASPVATMEHSSPVSSPSWKKRRSLRAHFLPSPFPAATPLGRRYAAGETLTEGALAKVDPQAAVAAAPSIEPFATPSAALWSRAVTSRRRSCSARARGRSMAPACASR
jgi:DNA polymerase III subunit gamma/tau